MLEQMWEQNIVSKTYGKFWGQNLRFLKKVGRKYLLATGMGARARATKILKCSEARARATKKNRCSQALQRCNVERTETIWKTV